MRKRYFFQALLIVLIFPIITYGQIEPREDAPNVVSELTEGRIDAMVLRLTEIDLDSGAQYFLTYRDGRYTQTYSSQVHRIGNKESLNDLKELILTLFEDEENEKDLRFEIGGDLASLSKMRVSRRDVVFLAINGKGHTKPLRESDWRKFFDQIDI